MPGLNKENFFRQQAVGANLYKGTPIGLTAEFPGATVEAAGTVEAASLRIRIWNVLIESKNCQPELCAHKHYPLRE